jgi:DNA-directed RNA polymerase specialized sigma subunit, sigma24 homolog
MSYKWDDNSLKLVVERHQKSLFALVVYLIGGDKNKAYAIAAAVFAETLRSASPLDTDSALLARLAHGAIEKCRDVTAVPSFDDSDFTGSPPVKIGSLRMIRKSLQSLPFDSKALLLLRDQMHLSYNDIAHVLGISENDARLRMTQTRAKLRKAVEEVVAHGG